MNNKKTYLVTGATGRVGSKVVRKLVAAGHGVRAFGRDSERLKPLAEIGATPFVGDMHDLASVTEAFRGVDAAMLAAQGDPTSHDYRAGFARAGTCFAEAAQATGLRHAVFVSTLGVHDDRNRGVILIHADVERILNRVPALNILHLRAPSFFENLFYFLPGLRARAELSWPVAADAAMDMAGTEDVAAVIVDRLLRLDFAGSSVMELHGPELVTTRRIAALISEELGRPFLAKPESREVDIDNMVAAGLGRDFCCLMNDGWDSFSRRLVVGEDPNVVHRTELRIKDWIRATLAPALRDTRGESTDSL
jgi:uncharacterized protein YbjT (DUF2867 family)